MNNINKHLIVGREVANIRRELTETERDSVGTKIANLVVELNDEAEDWKAESKAYNDNKKSKTEKLKVLAMQRKNGYFEGDMEVGLVPTEDGKRMQQVDLETFEVLGVRSMTPSERQLQINFEETKVREINANS